VKSINPARYEQYEEYMEHFTMYSFVIKCKELGIALNAEDFDLEQINVMFEILTIAGERERRKANGGKTRV